MSGVPASPEVRIGDAADVVEMLAADLDACVRRSFLERRRFTIAIPGGSVATRCFPRLARAPLEGSHLEFFWVDERAVPPTHPDSNYAQATSSWLEPAGVPAERIHRMPGEAADLALAARDYEFELTNVVGNPPRLDYVLLGVGPDGHVASLFPGHRALRETQSVLAITDAPSPPPRRLTLSLPVLISAARVVIVAFGKAKARVMQEAMQDPASILPVAHVARRASSSLILLDREAGSQIERGL